MLCESGSVSVAWLCSVLTSETLQTLLSDAVESLSWTAEAEFPTLLLCLREVSARIIAQGDGSDAIPDVIRTVVNATLQIYMNGAIATAFGAFLLQPPFVSR